jgi:hypothetical protein
MAIRARRAKDGRVSCQLVVYGGNTLEGARNPLRPIAPSLGADGDETG